MSMPRVPSSQLLSPSRGNAPSLRFQTRGDINDSALLGRLSALDDAVPKAPYLINLCDDRFNFTLLVCLGLLRTTPCLLPPDRLHQTCRELIAAYPGARCIHDRDLPETITKPDRDAAPNDDPSAPEIPFIDVDADAVIAFTPAPGGLVAHPKSWRQLTTTARALACSLDLTAAASLIATVPAQHMYGLEMAVMLPLTIGSSILPERPLFPTDIRTMLIRTPDPKVLISTPVHLSAIASSAGPWPSVDRVISATAPLTTQLAARIESMLNTQVWEVYGTTETGALATRRTLTHPSWTWLPGIRPGRRGDGRITINADHLPREIALPDRVALCAGGFQLLGASPDLVKVAGKRASLAALNRQLANIPGVQAGTFLPAKDPNDTVSRPMAFVVAPGLKRTDVLRGLQARIDPLFVPRKIVLLSELPLDAQGDPCRETLLSLVTDEPRHING